MLTEEEYIVSHASLAIPARLFPDREAMIRHKRKVRSTFRM